MSTHSLTLINKPLAQLKDRLCELFEVDSLMPAAEANDDDLIIEESPDGWTLLNDRGTLHVTASTPKFAKLFLKLSADTQSQIRSITIQTNAGYTHIFIAESGRVVRDYSYCEKVETDEGELPAWDEQIRHDAETTAWSLLGNEPDLPPNAPSKTDYVPLTSDLSQPIAGELRLDPPAFAISTRQLRRPFVEVPRATADGDALLVESANEAAFRIAAADVEKVFQNPFTREPLVVLKAKKITLCLSLPVANDVWDLLDRWSNVKFNRTPPKPSAPRKPKPPIVLQLVPVFGALIGGLVRIFQALLGHATKWGRGGVIDTIGTYGGGGFLAGTVVFAVGYWIWERSLEQTKPADVET